MPNDAVLTNPEPSPDEAMVAVFSSQNHDGEMESLAVQSMLQANGIPAMVVGPRVLPNLEFQVQVPEHMLVDAQRLIEEARAAGPEAAAEAEALTENQKPGSSS